MIDVGDKLREYLLTKTALTALVGTRIYAESLYPDSDYVPDDGAAIAFKTRGGGSETEEDALLVPSVQFKCYGADEIEAHACYRALYDALHHAHGATVRYAECETLGQTLEEPDTKWVFVLTFFRVWLG